MSFTKRKPDKHSWVLVFHISFVKVRKEFPKVTIMAGNVVTGEMVEELILSGADIIKVTF